MNKLVLAFSLFVSAAASADVVIAPAPTPKKQEEKKPLDFVFTHESGEASRDSSHHSSTWTVQGTKVHYTYRYSGRDGGMPGTADKDVDGVLKDPAAIQALLDAFDKTPTTSKMPTKFQDTRYETACIKRGKAERCIGALGGRDWDAPRPADFAALDALVAALMEQVKVPL